MTQPATALVFAEPTGVIRIWNAAAESLFGHRAAEAIGQTLDLIVPPDYRARHWEGFRAAVANGRTKYPDGAANIPVLCQDGTVVRFPGRLIFLRDAREQVVGAMAIFSGREGAGPPLPDL